MKIGKFLEVLIEFLNSRTSRAPICKHVHEKEIGSAPSTQHDYPYLKDIESTES